MSARFPELFVERYRRFIPDFDDFLAALSRPPARTVRVNTLKATRDEALAWLSDMNPEPLPWWDLALRVPGSGGLGKKLAHFLGLFYVQDAASMVPPLVLGPRPGERVLDLAAAPGSKTTQMSAMMANTGLVIANDYSRGRVRGLIGNVDRAGCLNVAICRMDGIKLGRELAGTCDRVLVDAPCSAEGTICRSDQALDRWSPASIEMFGRVQKGLIVAGYRALVPGGVMVYSTCTIAPEENEGTVAYLLSRYPEAELLPVEVDGFRMRPGLAGWEGRDYPGAVRNCRRILPQDNDTEAFFVALVRKPEEGTRVQGFQGSRGKTDKPRAAGPADREAVGPLVRRFGIPAPVFEPYRTLAGQGAVFIATPEVMAFDAVRPMRRGIRLCRVFPRSVKPTSWAMQSLGRRASRNVIDLDEDQAAALVNGAQLRPGAGVDVEDGFVIVRCRGFVVGVGLFRRPVLKSQIPGFRPVETPGENDG